MSTQLKESDPYELGQLAGPVEAAAERIDTKVGEAAKTLYEIGVELREVKPLLRGKWEAWVNARIGWSVDKADKLIAASVTIDANPALRKLLGVRHDKSIFNLLTAPSTPAEAIADVVERIESGELPTLDDVKEIVEDARSPQPSEKWTCPNCGGQERDTEACKACHEPLTPARDHQRDFADDAAPVSSTASERRLRSRISSVCSSALGDITEEYGDLIRSDASMLKAAVEVIKDEMIGNLKRYAKGDGE